ncbi:MAG: hypothetical protein WAN48_11000 [Actinomycetes bacterium]
MNPDAAGTAAISEYLDQLRRAAVGLAPDRRAELLDQIGEHLDDVSNAPGATEADVRTAIDRLGDPSDIVAADQVDGPSDGLSSLGPSDGLSTLGAAPAATAPMAARSPWGPLEIIAVAFLIVGGFLVPVVGPIIGLVCALASSRWTRGEKAVAGVLSLTAPTLVVFSLVGIRVFAS